MINLLPLLSKIRKTDSCWEWTGCKVKGYGQISINKRRYYTHRVVYELLVGEIPKGLQLDHLCRNRSCVNPTHLEPVTSKENLRRGNSPSAINKRKTECLRGHELLNNNVWVAPNGSRKCRECSRIRKREYRMKLATA